MIAIFKNLPKGIRRSLLSGMIIPVLIDFSKLYWPTIIIYTLVYWIIVFVVLWVYSGFNNINGLYIMNATKLKPSEKLDILLNYFNDVEIKFSSLNELGLDVHKHTGNNFSNKELWQIVEKLKKDHFIDDFTRITGNKEVAVNIITFEGQALLEIENGYTGRLKKENKGKIKNVLFDIFKPLAGVLVGVLLTYYLKKDQ